MTHLNHHMQKDSKKFWGNSPRRLLFTMGALCIVASLLSACSAAPSALAPEGYGAREIGRLSWILIAMGTVVYLGVGGFALLALFHRGRGSFDDAPDAHDTEGNRSRQIMLWGGLVMPAVVLLVIFGLTLNTLISLSALARSDEITIDVIGHQWWWEVQYPEQGIISANEIHVPVGRSVRINLEASGVIHSFWVPQLHGKLDMIPGHTNTFHIRADAPGEYRGICAEFCGIQHAKMLFLVIAHPPEEFEQWLAQESQPAASPESASAQAGRELFNELTCNECHAIGGTDAVGLLGPDLTHFASRREIGSGIMENNRDNLSGWIENAQASKPGNLMPAFSLTETELTALVDYMETLK